RPVLELPGGIGLRVDVGDLLELERPLEGDRVVDAAAEEEGVLAGREALGPRLHLGLEVEGVLHAARDEAKLLERRALLFRAQPAARLRDGEGQGEERGKLGREGLRGGDADLLAGARVEDEAGGPRDGALAHVADREGLRVPELLRALQG